MELEEPSFTFDDLLKTLVAALVSNGGELEIRDDALLSAQVAGGMDGQLSMTRNETEKKYVLRWDAL